MICRYRNLTSLTVSTTLPGPPGGQQFSLSLTASLTGLNDLELICGGPKQAIDYTISWGIIEATARNPRIKCHVFNPAFLLDPPASWLGTFCDWDSFDPGNSDSWLPSPDGSPTQDFIGRTDSPCGLPIGAPFGKAGAFGGKYIALDENGAYAPCQFTSGNTFWELLAYDAAFNPIGTGSFSVTYT